MQCLLRCPSATLTMVCIHLLRCSFSQTLPPASPTWPVVVLTSSAGPIQRQLTGRPISDGMVAEATMPRRSLRMMRRWEVSSAAQAAAAVPAPSQPLWKLLSPGISDCQATCRVNYEHTQFDVTGQSRLMCTFVAEMQAWDACGSVTIMLRIATVQHIAASHRRCGMPEQTLHWLCCCGSILCAETSRQHVLASHSQQLTCTTASPVRSCRLARTGSTRVLLE